MSEHNKSLLACRMIPTIKGILNVIGEVANSDGSVETGDSRVESILKVSNACKQGLEIISDLCLPPVKPRLADLTDAGPGVGVSNYEVRFRDAELARIHNSDYRVRCHRSRGDSRQGEAENEQTRPFQTILLTVQRWNGRSTVDSKISLKTKSLHSYEKYEKECMEKTLGMFASRSPKG